MFQVLLCIAWLSLAASFLYIDVNVRNCRRCHDSSSLVVSILRRQLRHQNNEDLDVPDFLRERKLNTLPVFVPVSAAMIMFSPLSSVAEELKHEDLVLDARYFLAGGLCAAFSHGVTTPLDVVKTRIQVDPTNFQEGGVVGAALQIIREDGSAALLAGLGPTVIGYGLEGAAKFGLYESLKPEMVRLLALESPVISYLLASAVAGAAASIILCPMERTRIRLVTEPNFSSNFLTGIPWLLKESGVKGLLYGLPAMLSKQVPYTAGKQISFDAFAALLYSVAAKAGLSEEAIKFEVSLGAAALASGIACVMSHPGDVILTQAYKGSSNRSFAGIMSSIYEDKGLEGFLSGIAARFIHVGTIITSQLVLYDIIKQLLGLPATGSS